MPSTAWSTDARLAAQVWIGMSAATRWEIMRRYGNEAALEVDFGYMRRHHLAHFLDGVGKLGIDSEPHPVLCAKYHAFSNMLGGVDMGYAEESGRGWIFYLPPDAFAGSVLLGSPAIYTVGPETMVNVFRAWHGYNSVSLDNPRLRFVVTDVVQAGGPYHAGYFDEAPRPLPLDRRVELRLGETSVRPGPVPQLAGDWPQSRRDKALQKYAGEYSIVMLAESAEKWGMGVAAEIAEVAHRAVFLQWARLLVNIFDVSESDAAAEVAEVFCRALALLGDDVARVDQGPMTYVHHRSSRLAAPHYGWSVLPREIEEAFARAWRTVSHTLGGEVDKISVVKSRAQGASETVWQFARGG